MFSAEASILEIYDGRRRSADAELWRPSQPDVAKGEQGRSRERSPPASAADCAGARPYRGGPALFLSISFGMPTFLMG